MKDFPAFMKQPANRIATRDQATPGVEGYVFDGADDSQMAFWTCSQSTAASPQAHEFDEYMIVVDGCYTLILDGKKIDLRRGDEFFVPRGTLHGGEVVAGTRTIHAFGGRRAERTRHEAR